MPANSCISVLTHFQGFHEIYSGCCTRVTFQKHTRKLSSSTSYRASVLEQSGILDAEHVKLATPEAGHSPGPTRRVVDLLEVAHGRFRSSHSIDDSVTL
jgi:hypothetical protein